MGKTNFINSTDKVEPKKTVFNKSMSHRLDISTTRSTVDDFENIELILRHNTYGDVFLVWNNDKNNCWIFFGEAGDEFK